MINVSLKYPDLKNGLSGPCLVACILLPLAALLSYQTMAQPQYTPPPPPPPVQAQPTPEPRPGEPLAPKQLDQLVARIALYPDPLLAQILPASTY